MEAVLWLAVTVLVLVVCGLVLQLTGLRQALAREARSYGSLYCDFMAERERANKAYSVMAEATRVMREATRRLQEKEKLIGIQADVIDAALDMAADSLEEIGTAHKIADELASVLRQGGGVTWTGKGSIARHQALAKYDAEYGKPEAKAAEPQVKPPAKK